MENYSAPLINDRNVVNNKKNYHPVYIIYVHSCSKIDKKKEFDRSIILNCHTCLIKITFESYNSILLNINVHQMFILGIENKIRKK